MYRPRGDNSPQHELEGRGWSMGGECRCGGEEGTQYYRYAEARTLYSAARFGNLGEGRGFPLGGGNAHPPPARRARGRRRGRHATRAGVSSSPSCAHAKCVRWPLT